MAKIKNLLGKKPMMMAEDLFDKSLTQFFDKKSGEYVGTFRNGDAPGYHVAKIIDENGIMQVSVNPNQISIF